MGIDGSRIRSIVESLIFVSEEPLSFRKIRAILEGVPTKELKRVLDEIIEEYRTADRGVTIELVADGYQMRTRPENHEWIKMLLQYKPTRLSKAALETLAIIAYRQPTTKTDAEKIRGVDCSSAVSKLLELGLVKILGRKEVPGRPFIYGTTPEFLEVFNLSGLNDLPSLKEIEELNPEDVEAFAADLAETANIETEEEFEEGEAAETDETAEDKVEEPEEVNEDESDEQAENDD